VRGAGHEPVVFHAAGPCGAPVYHTNVMLAIGRRFALVCAEAIAAAERGAVLERLADAGRQVETISAVQMARFAGNLLELDAASGAACSPSRSEAGTVWRRTRVPVPRRGRQVVAVPVPAIEDAGGGSVRCMLAEVFLPRA